MTSEEEFMRIARAGCRYEPWPPSNSARYRAELLGGYLEVQDRGVACGDFAAVIP